MRKRRRQLWLVLVVETVFLGVLAAWVLIRLDRLLEPVSLLVAAAIIVISDVAAVVLMQAAAPTRITFSPGEGESRGRVLDGFGARGRGRVLLGGERWSARGLGSAPLHPGDPVRVVSRRGLSLIVERARSEEPRG